MNFDLGPQERALAEGVREVSAKRLAVGAPIDRDGWRALEDAGVFALRVAEEDGGLGQTMAAAAVVFEELGRALVPGPIADTHIGRARGATEDVIVVVTRDARTIPHLSFTDVVAIIDDDGLWRVLPDAVDADEIEPPLDPLTPVHRVRSLPRGERIVGTSIAAALRVELEVLLAAQSVGIAAATTDAAVAYAKQREQFGRPIGSFQAVKHLCADMLVRTEVARAAVYAAACTLDDPAVGDLQTAVATAALLASDAAITNGKASIQVHGGMGFTWEVDQHLYLKRAVVLRARLGGTHVHEERMAEAL